MVVFVVKDLKAKRGARWTVLKPNLVNMVLCLVKAIISRCVSAQSNWRNCKSGGRTTCTMHRETAKIDHFTA